MRGLWLVGSGEGGPEEVLGAGEGGGAGFNAPAV